MVRSAFISQSSIRNNNVTNSDLTIQNTCPTTYNELLASKTYYFLKKPCSQWCPNKRVKKRYSFAVIFNLVDRVFPYCSFEYMY